MTRLTLATASTLLAVLIIAAVSVSAQTAPIPVKSVQIEILPAVKYSLGKTDYELEGYAFDTLGNRLYIKSKLDFPLDGVVVGGALRLTLAPTEPLPWIVRVAAYTNVNDPGKKMTDKDWSNLWFDTLGQDVYLPRIIEVSSTESDAQMTSILLEGELSKGVSKAFSGEIRLFAGFRYHRVNQKLFGLKGFQYNVEGDSLRYFDAPGLHGLDYRITYSLPHAGLELNLPLGPKGSMALRGAYAIAMISDRDDHLLRKKLSTSDITGSGFIGGADLTVAMSRNNSRPNFVSLTG